LAQVALSFGADDLHGTIMEEHIFHMAGAGAPQSQSEAAMVKAIREAGLTPVRRDTFYQPIKVWDDVAHSGEAGAAESDARVLRDNLATA
jgi:aminodeoxyfutalosine synthase